MRLIPINYLNKCLLVDSEKKISNEIENNNSYYKIIYTYLRLTQNLNFKP